MNPEQKADLFWELAGPLIARGQADKSTMMGFPCLRVEGKFFASIERGTNNLIVKLPAERVSRLVESGQAQNFAPNGRVFREWALFEEPDETEWAELLVEARRFVLST